MGLTPLAVECIESDEGLSALAPEWEQLFAATGSHLPFWTFDWAESWWKHFQRDRLSVSDALRVYAVRAAGGALIAVAPMILTERPGRGPLRARSLHFFGADPNMTELKGVVCAPADAERVHRCLLRYFQECDTDWDWLEWAGLTEDCRHLVAVRADVESRREIPGFLLRLPPTWEELKLGLKRNIRESLRKCYNSLQRDGHSFEFQVVQDESGVTAALGDFFRLHSARFSLEGTVHHADVFATEHSRRFLQEVSERLAARGQWRAFILRIGGAVVAVRLGFRFGDALYLYYSGFEPEWGKYSVMTTTVAESIKHSIANGVTAINLSTGNDVSKTRWGPEEISHLDLIMSSSKARSRFVRRAYRMVVKVHSEHQQGAVHAHH